MPGGVGGGKLRGASLSRFHVCWGYRDEVQECDTEVNSEAAEQMLTALEQKQDKHKKEEESK